MSLPLHVIILAAGEGKRMKSARPKVLQPIAGQPMRAHVIQAVRALTPAAIHVVYGHGGEDVRNTFADQPDLIVPFKRSVYLQVVEAFRHLADTKA